MTSRALFAILLLACATGASAAAAVRWPPPPDFEGVAPADAPAVVEQLAPEQQAFALEHRWRQIGSPAMLPLLRKLYAENPWQTKPPAGHDEASVKDWALYRLYQFAPAEGRPLILKELRNPGLRLPVNGIHAVLRMPDKVLPELDDLLAARLEGRSADRETIAALVERYATAAVKDRLLKFYSTNRGNWACNDQTLFLAYFLRVDPDLGGRLVDQAVGWHGPAFTGCSYSVLSDVARREYNTALERVAIKHLAHPSPGVAADAAGVLGDRGSPAAEAALWRQLEAWHKQWAGKADALKREDPDRDSRDDPAAVGGSLAGALAEGANWLADAEDLRRIAKLCVLPDAAGWYNGLADDAAEGPVRIGVMPVRPTDDFAYVIGQYHLRSLEQFKRKLAQYPRGTSFMIGRLSADGDDPDALVAAESELSFVVRTAGHTVIVEPEDSDVIRLRAAD